MLCPKCGNEMPKGILGGRGYNFFLPEGDICSKRLVNSLIFR